MFPGAKLITHWGVETKPAVTLPATRFKRTFFRARDDTVPDTRGTVALQGRPAEVACSVLPGHSQAVWLGGW